MFHSARFYSSLVDDYVSSNADKFKPEGGCMALMPKEMGKTLSSIVPIGYYNPMITLLLSLKDYK